MKRKNKNKKRGKRERKRKEKNSLGLHRLFIDKLAILIAHLIEKIVI